MANLKEINAAIKDGNKDILHLVKTLKRGLNLKKRVEMI